ncbi:MAG: hypothetical protein KDD31_04565 [Muricauda sp.]|nr:hypothetical protein [Allomuricauda sp.]
MKKVVTLIFCLVVAVSCIHRSEKIDKTKIAEDYISALDNSDYNKVADMFLDSIRFNEMEYIRTFTREGYRDLIQWDSVFQPSYKVLEMKEAGEELHLKVSKTCDRIMFLQGEPFISREVIKFKEGAIYSVDVVEYVDFNDSLWSANRENLVLWIDEHHPELNGFIYDQTKKGAVNYLKAMDLYRNRKDSILEHSNSNK